MVDLVDDRHGRMIPDQTEALTLKQVGVIREFQADWQGRPAVSSSGTRATSEFR
jgi:hypothetical protein